MSNQNDNAASEGTKKEDAFDKAMDELTAQAQHALPNTARTHLGSIPHPSLYQSSKNPEPTPSVTAPGPKLSDQSVVEVWERDDDASRKERLRDVVLREAEGMGDMEQGALIIQAETHASLEEIKALIPSVNVELVKEGNRAEVVPAKLESVLSAKWDDNGANFKALGLLNSDLRYLRIETVTDCPITIVQYKTELHLFYATHIEAERFHKASKVTIYRLCA